MCVSALLRKYALQKKDFTSFFSFILQFFYLKKFPKIFTTYTIFVSLFPSCSHPSTTFGSFFLLNTCAPKIPKVSKRLPARRQKRLCCTRTRQQILRVSLPIFAADKAPPPGLPSPPGSPPGCQPSSPNTSGSLTRPRGFVTQIGRGYQRSNGILLRVSSMRFLWRILMMRSGRRKEAFVSHGAVAQFVFEPPRGPHHHCGRSACHFFPRMRIAGGSLDGWLVSGSVRRV